MKTTYFITLLFFFFSFDSFASESDSKNSTLKEITVNHLAKKSKIITTKNQKKLNFKERLALKLVKKKFRKVQKQKEYSKKRKHETKNNSINILLILWLIVGITIGLYYIIFNELLSVIFLILIGAVGIALILFLLFAILLLILPSDFPIS